MLDRHKVQRIASERWLLAASVCLVVSASAPYECLIGSRHVDAIYSRHNETDTGC